ncbi:MFS general substrate transporter [Trametes versicolor FP-101664 SS1]|uniref:MFS general substrate transporter n=1 Tax=Trametes versicolor (strain FP-101664) TaxID=717944 RepID=UPI0004621483|nr:MFS general substrate transporter [Trametes versicolor FP-101664 SS1]EIW52382.1 MFS general substrate transporter [Trametes versicolor FP-101664 SS1]
MQDDPDAKGTSTPATYTRSSSRAALHSQDPQEGATVQELPPIDRGIKAWTFCFSAFVLEMMVWGFSFSYGIFQDYYTSHPPFENSSSIAIAAVGTVALALQYGESIFLSFVYGRYPDFMRTGMWAGLLLYFISLFCSSFATEVWQLILLQGVGVGIGGGLLYMPVIQLIPEWFSERRGLAGGIIFAGTGLGGFVFPFVLNVLLDKVGLGWTLRIWAISTSLFSGIALLGMRNRLPVPKFTALNRRPRFIPPHIGFVRNPLFWTFAITNMLQGLSYFPVSLYIATFTRNVANQLTATIVLALFNSSAVVGQIIMGHLSDRFPYPSIMVFSAVGSALSAFFLWGFADAAIFLYFFAVIFGGLSGGFSSTWPNAAVESVGGQVEYAGMSFAGTAFFKGISAVIGPVISGLLLQSGNGASLGGGFGKFGYGAVEIFVGSCALATGAGSVAVAFARRRVQP